MLSYNVSLQVCLAAETCGHVNFNTRQDVWYSSEPFHCGYTEPGEVSLGAMFRKVKSQSSMLHICLDGGAWECDMLDIALWSEWCQQCWLCASAVPKAVLLVLLGGCDSHVMGCWHSHW